MSVVCVEEFENLSTNLFKFRICWLVYENFFRCCEECVDQFDAINQ